MYAQKEPTIQTEPTQEFLTYNKIAGAAAKLDKENDQKSNIIFNAYQAAVEELGYTNKELMSSNNSKEVARIMFSDKYLGNEEFNPLLKGPIYEGFAEKDDMEKERLFQHMLSINEHSMTAQGGLIDKYGSLQRSTMAAMIDRTIEGQSSQQLISFVWNKIYDPQKSFSDNIDNYFNILKQDPILAHTGAKLNKGRFHSIDEVAEALVTSAQGKTSKEHLQYGLGAKFN